MLVTSDQAKQIAELQKPSKDEEKLIYYARNLVKHYGTVFHLLLAQKSSFGAFTK